MNEQVPCDIKCSLCGCQAHSGCFDDVNMPMTCPGCGSLYSRLILIFKSVNPLNDELESYQIYDVAYIMNGQIIASISCIKENNHWRRAKRKEKPRVAPIILKRMEQATMRLIK